MKRFSTTLKLSFFLCFLLAGIASTTAQTLYWVNGSGSWNESSHWSLSSGGAGGAGVPTLTNDVAFDKKSFTQNSAEVTINAPAFCNNLTWKGTEKFSPALIGTSNTSLAVGGSLLLQDKIDNRFNGSIVFTANGQQKIVAKTPIKSDLLFVGTASYAVDQQAISVDKVKILDGSVTASGKLLVGSKPNSSQKAPTGPKRIVSTISPSNTPVTCFGGSDGTLTINITGGSPPYIYTIFDLSNPTYSFNQATSNLSVTFTNLRKALYIISVQDASTDALTSSSSLGQPIALTINASASNVTCTGASDGKITAQAQGGSAPYTYVLKDNLANTVGAPLIGAALTPVTFTNIAPGTGYTVWVTDSKYALATPPNQAGCGPIISSAVDIVESPALLKLDLTNTTDGKCNGDNSGKAVVTASDGMGPYTFSISPAAGTLSVLGSTATFENLPKNNYTAKVTDSYGCEKTVNFTINEPALLTGKIDLQTNLDCKGALPAIGSVTVSAIGGTSPFTYTISPTGVPLTVGPTAIPATFGSLAAGNYIVNITDTEGCTTTLLTDIDVTITEPATAVTITTETKTDITCNTSSNGIVNVKANGGTGALTYNLFLAPAVPKGSNGTGDFTSLAPGTYYVEVVDTKGCKKTSINLVIAEPTTVLATETLPLHQNVNCFGGNTGSFTIVGSGGNSGSYTYSFQGGAFSATNTFSPLTANTYTVVVKDSKGCLSLPISVTITQKAAITGPVTGIVHLKCKGVNNGAFKVTAAGGTAPYTFKASLNGVLPPAITGDAAGNFSGLAPGVYSVTITDINGCINPAPISVTINDAVTAVLTATISSTPVTCAGIIPPTGTVTVTASGGLTNYTYSITGVGPGVPAPLPPNQVRADAAIFTALGQATYTVTVTDANGCTITPAPSIAVLESATPVAVALTSIKAPKCNAGPSAATGEVTLTASGGTGTYFFKKSADPLYPATPSINPFTFTGLTSGSHTFWVKDSYGCEKSIIVNVVPDADMSVVSLTSTPIRCKGESNGTVALKVAGGNPPYKTYTLNQTGALGTEDPITNIVTFSGLIAGTYSITVIDNNDCSFITPTIVVDEALVALTASTTKIDVLCSGGNTGSITITRSGGEPPFQFKIGAGAYPPAVVGEDAKTFSPLTQGSYNVYVKDAYGCEVMIPVTITEPTALTFDAATTTPVKCKTTGSDGTITIKANGGTINYKYELKKGAVVVDTKLNEPAGVTFSGLVAGNDYTVTVTDANLCTLTTPVAITVTEPAVALTAVVTPTKNVTCNGGSDGIATVTASGGTGTYTFAISPVGPGITVDVTGTIATINTLQAIPYTVTIKDNGGLGCAITRNILLTEPTAITLTETPSPVTGCYGNANGSIQVTASGGTGPYSYKLSPNNTTNLTGLFGSLRATDLSGVIINYTVTVTDNLGCTKVSNVITLTQPTEVTFTTVVEQPNCALNGGKGKITITASGGTAPYQYSNQGGILGSWVAGNVFSNLDPNSYFIKVKDTPGCLSKVTKVDIVAINQIRITDLSAHHIETCSGDNSGYVSVTVIGGTPPYEYSLDEGTGPGPWQPSNTFLNLKAGLKTVTVRDQNGCTDMDSKVLTEPNPIKINKLLTLVQPVTGCYNNTDGEIFVVASGGTAPLTYSIDGNPSQTDGYFQNLGKLPNPHLIRIQDAKGCIKDTVIVIDGPPDIVLDPTTTVTNISCHGMATPDGQVNVVATGGTVTPPSTLKYSLDGGPTQPTGAFINLTSGPHTVTVTDDNGCALPYPFEIIDPAPLTVTPVGTNPSCSVMMPWDGKITATSTGGTFSGGTPKLYRLDRTSPTPWTSGWTTNPLFSPLEPGDYTITVQDNNLCEKSADLTLTPPSPITVDPPVSVNPTCTDPGSITVVAHGGTGAYTFTLNPGPGEIVITDIAQAVFTGLGANTYTVSVTDSKGCTPAVTGPIVLTSPSTLKIDRPNTIASVVNVTPCFGDSNGSIDIKVTGATAPILYSINDGANYFPTSLFTGLTAGTYLIKVNDAVNCPATDLVPVTEPSPLVIVVAGKVEPTIGNSDGEIHVTATGGTGLITFTISPNVGTQPTPGDFIGLPADTYTVTATDANGCTATTVIGLSDFTADITSTDVTCNGANDGTITLTVGGSLDFTITWTKDGILYDTEMNAKYDGNGYKNLEPGVYEATITDNISLKIIILTTTILEPAPIAITDVVVLPKSQCGGKTQGQITIIMDPAGGPYEYSIDNGVTFLPTSVFTGLASGSYNVVIRVGTCTSAWAANPIVLPDYSDVPDPIVLTQDPGAILTVVCPDDLTASVNYTATGGVAPYTFTWRKWITLVSYYDLPNGSNLGKGKYEVTVTDNNGCSKSEIFFVTCPVPDIVITKDLLNSKDALCRHFEQDLSNPVIPDPKVNLGAITVNVSGGTPVYSYTWTRQSSDLGLDNNDPFINHWLNNKAFDLLPSSNYSDITYSVTVTDANMCKHTERFKIGYANTLTPEIRTTKMPIFPLWVRDTACYNGVLKMWTDTLAKKSYDNVYKWAYYNPIPGFDNATTDTVYPIFKDTTIVKLLVNKKIAEGLCVDWDTLKVHLYPRLGVKIIKDEKFEDEKTIVLPVNVSYNLTSTIMFNTTHPIKFSWGNDGTLFNPTEGNRTTINIPPGYPLVFNEEDRRYSIKIYPIATDQITGCVDTDSVRVKVLKSISIPNAFSPNGDAINDTWAIWDITGVPINFLFPNIEVEVFNRWGSRVFYSKGYNKPWDGKSLSGDDLPVGTYYFVIQYNRDGYSNEVGSVTILR